MKVFQTEQRAFREGGRLSGWCVVFVCVCGFVCVCVYTQWERTENNSASGVGALLHLVTPLKGVCAEQSPTVLSIAQPHTGRRCLFHLVEEKKKNSGLL